jgi:hypothetical protein
MEKSIFGSKVKKAEPKHEADPEAIKLESPPEHAPERKPQPQVSEKKPAGSAKTAQDADKHNLKKFDKFKRGNR